MGEVKLLNYKYFLGAAPLGGKSNDYSGSITLNPAHHSAFDDEFKYRVKLEKADDGTFRLKAECCVGSVCFAETDPSIIQSQEFEGSDDGVAQAKQWLEDAYEAVVKGAAHE